MMNAHVGNPIVTASGTAACLAAARAAVPIGATLLLSETAYYETVARLTREATLRNWTIESFDPLNTSDAVRRIGAIASRERLVVWIDQPANWWMDAVDLRTIAVSVHKKSGIVICDVSVHPLVSAIDQGADIEVLSLSKYPSNGLALGGLVSTNREDLRRAIAEECRHEASLIAAESAFAISQQLLSFVDRFSSVAEKAARLAAWAEQLSGVASIRYPDARVLSTTHAGGMFVLELRDEGFGMRAEEIIMQNFHRTDFALTLACTFGGPLTTFEHFQQRGGEAVDEPTTLAKPLPKTFCRIGVGGEPFECIRDSLALAFPPWP